MSAYGKTLRTHWYPAPLWLTLTRRSMHQCQVLGSQRHRDCGLQGNMCQQVPISALTSPPPHGMVVQKVTSYGNPQVLAAGQLWLI
jgi:hypothetical protein